MAKPWKNKSGRNKKIRKIQRHLIVCEDAKSAADYFRAFKVSKEFAEVVVEGGAGNTASVVEKALKFRDNATKQGAPYATVWCVFDRDSFPAANFNRAFDLTTGNDKHDVHVIWSNECFELWYLLHFEFVVASLGRDEIYKKLSEDTRLGKKYNKADKSVFEMLDDKIEIAKKNAAKLLADYGADLNPEKANPSTKVHELVIVLQKLAELKAP